MLPRLLHPQRRPLRPARHRRRQPHHRQPQDRHRPRRHRHRLLPATSASPTAPSTRPGTTASAPSPATRSATRAPPTTSPSPTATSPAPTSSAPCSTAPGRSSPPTSKSARTGRIKCGTESNGGFRNITISNCVFEGCKGIALETVDGALLEDIAITNITMRDIVAGPLFLRLGSRLRGPKDKHQGRHPAPHPHLQHRQLQRHR